MNEINYEVGFANVSWDNGYNNGIHFVHREPYELINTEFGITWLPSTKKINFIRRNQGQNAFLKIDTTDIIGIDFEQCFQFNYCIVKKVYKNAEGEITGSEYFYYFINNAHQSIQYKNCIEYILERDIVAQLKLNVDYTIPSVFTERNHQSRMINGSLNLDYNSPANHSDKIEKVSTNQKLLNKIEVFDNIAKVPLDSFYYTPMSDYIQVNPATDYAEVEVSDILLMFFTSIRLCQFKGQNWAGDNWLWDDAPRNGRFYVGSTLETATVPIMAFAAPTMLKLKRVFIKRGDGTYWVIDVNHESLLVSQKWKYRENGTEYDIYGDTSHFGTYSADYMLQKFRYGVEGYKDITSPVSTTLDYARLFSYFTVDSHILNHTMFEDFRKSRIAVNYVSESQISGQMVYIQGDGQDDYKCVPKGSGVWGVFAPEFFTPVFELSSWSHEFSKVFDISSNINSISNGEPKMLKHPYSSMVLTNETTGASFDYSILSSCESNGTVDVREAITLFPSGTEYSIFLNSGQYKQENSNRNFLNNNFVYNIGAIGKIKQSLPVMTSAYNEWLMNNANAFVSRVVIPTATAAYGAIGMGYDKNVGTTWAMDSKMNARYNRNVSKYEDPNAYAQFLANTGDYNATRITQTDYDRYTTMNGDSLIGAMSGVAQYAAQMECLKATPDNLSNMATMSVNNLVGGKNRTLLSFYTITDREKETFKDIFFKVGYEVDKLMSSTEWFSRSKFNFIQINDNCQNKIVSSKRIGKVEKDLINDILNRGITLWDEDEFHNNKNFSYDLAGDNSEV